MPCTDCNDDDKYVKISINDTKSSFLKNKLIDGDDITFVIINPGENEKLKPVLKKTQSLSIDSPDLIITSSDNTILYSQAGDKKHIANLRVKVSTDAGNAIVKSNGLYVALPNYNIKLNAQGNPAYLDQLITLKTDPLGIVIPQAITEINGKLNLGYTINLEALCSALTTLPCFSTQVPVCNTEITSLSVVPASNGNATVTVVYTGNIPIQYAYKIGDGDYTSILNNPFTVSGLSGSNLISVKSMCSNGVYGNIVTKSFSIPAPLCSANIITLQSTNSNSNGTISISWSATGYSYFTYKVDNGPIITTTNTSINLVGQGEGEHIVTVKAYCANNIEGDSVSINYIIPPITCSAIINSIFVSGESDSGTASVSWTSTGASRYKYNINNGIYINTVSTFVILTGLSGGVNIIKVIPICSNTAEGVGLSSEIIIPSAPICNPPSNVLITTTITQNFVAYYGYKPTNVILTTSEIESSTSVVQVTGATVTANYSANIVPSYLWVAIPTTEPIRSTWYSSSLDNGTFAPDQSFGQPVIVGAYRFYQTNYGTSQDIPIQFRV